MPDSWKYHKCANCKSIYLQNQPDTKSLALAYSDYYTHHPEIDFMASNPANSVLFRLINGYFNKRFGLKRAHALYVGYILFKIIPPAHLKLDVYGRHLPSHLLNPHTQLLDVGCGNGSFLLRANEMGITTKGCEPDANAVTSCLSLGLDVTQGDLMSIDYAKESFDYITLSHVIEHTNDAKKILFILHDLLKPKGHLWLALPNPNAFSIKIFKQGWKGFHPPYHLLIPSQAVIKEWLSQAGFINIKFIKYGIESRGLWNESLQIARREGVNASSYKSSFYRIFVSILSSLTPRWGDETIVLAQRPDQQ